MKIEFDSDSKGFAEAREILAITRYLLGTDAHLNRDLILSLERAALHHLQTPELRDMANTEGISESLFKGKTISKRLRGFWENFVSPGIKTTVDEQQNELNLEMHSSSVARAEQLSNSAESQSEQTVSQRTNQNVKVNVDHDVLASAIDLEDKISELQASLEKISSEDQQK